jgi:hypothetical protein
MFVIFTLNLIILIVGFLVAGKRRKTQIAADKNETQNIPEQDNLSREDGRVVSGIPKVDRTMRLSYILSFFFFFFCFK